MVNTSRLALSLNMPYLSDLSPHRHIPGLIIVSMLFLGPGCSTTPDTADTTAQDSSTSQDLSSTDEQIFVGDSIEMSYDPNVIMKRAESFFDKESYAEAIVEYKHFLDLHRNHMLAPYAQYKIGLSHYKQFRTVDRDPEPLKNSIAGFEKLLKEFPSSRYEAEAKKTILLCKEQLVQRHLMVGEFYFKRGSYLAAAHRYEKIINEFPEVEKQDEAMFLLAKTYQDLGIKEWTQEWLVALMQQYPDSSYHSSAQSLLADLHEEDPTLLTALPNNPLVPNNTAALALSTDSATPPIQEDPVFSNSGTLPKTSIIEAQTAIAAEPSSASSACAIGSWCDPQSVTPTPLANPELSPPNPKACKTGEWC